MEAGLHRAPGVLFREEDCRVGTDHAPENVATVWKMAPNTIRRDGSTRASAKTKR
jgi:predicted transposase YbfD/YdcC